MCSGKADNDTVSGSKFAEGWLGSSCEERAASPQNSGILGLAALDPSDPSPLQIEFETTESGL